MKPTRNSFSCGQPLGPEVAHHGMRDLIQYIMHKRMLRLRVVSGSQPRWLTISVTLLMLCRRLQTYLAALRWIMSSFIYFSGCVGSIPWKHIPNVVELVIGRHVF